MANPGFEDAAQDPALARGWSRYGEGYERAREGRDGGWCIRCRSEDGKQTLGAAQELTFDPPVRHPFLVSGWSRAEGVEGGEYSVYLDVHYADGTPLWGQQALFRRGTHDWAYAEHLFTPAKPVARIQVFVLFRRAKGAAWFDDLRVSLAPHRFTRATALGGFTGAGRVEARAAVSLPSAWRAEVSRQGRVVFTQQGEGLSQRLSWDGRDADGQPVPPGPCTVRFAATDRLLGETVTWSQDVDTAGAQPGRTYALWTESGMRRVLPTDLPETEDPPAALALSAARNESESGQLVLLPPSDRPLRNVRATVSDLLGPGGARIDARNVEWHLVAYVWIEEQAKGHPFVRQVAPGWWPDPLLPVERFDVEPDWAQPVWITVHVPAGTAPGSYEGRVTLSADGNPDASVPVRLTVHDFTLPAEGHLKNTFALMQGYLEKVYGKEKVTPELRQAYGAFLLAYRMNPDDITRTDLPVLEDLERYRSRGLNAFNVLNPVEPRKGAWNCYSPVSFYTPAFKQSLIATLDPFVAELKKRNLFGKAYVYGFDEREEEYRPIIREYFGMLKERYGLPTLTTAKIPQDPAAMRDLNVDWLCPISNAYSFEDAERCRAEGLQVWTYVCCGPRYPFANFLADDPLIEARVILWQAFHQKLDGFLYWGVNVWWHKNNDHPIDPATGPRLDWSITTRGMPFLHGDGVLIYPLADGRPAGSIRLANLRDGLEDYEVLWALGKKRGDVWFARASCEPVTASLTAFTRDPAVLSAARERLVRELSAGAGGRAHQP